jgi:hypothetical protein
MKHYKNKDGVLFGFLEDGSQDAFIPADFVRITEEEANILREEHQKKVAEQMKSLMPNIK